MTEKLSAATLFRDFEDVRFRLQDTYIKVGRHIFRVEDMTCRSYNDTRTTKIIGREISGRFEKSARLGLLPLQTMFDAPVGYHLDRWYSRGPIRNRFQGITVRTMWGLNPYGDVIQGADVTLSNLLLALNNQPEVFSPPPGFRKGSGIRTNKVMITKGDAVIYRGRYIGDLFDKHSFKSAITDPTQQMMSDLSKALLIPR